MQTFNNASALFWTRLFNAVSIVAKLMLIDSRNTADCSNRGVRGAHLEQSCSIQMVLEFVVTIAKPLWDIVTICHHSFYMKIQCVTNLVNQFVV